MTTAGPNPAPSGASPGSAASPAAESAEGTLKAFGYDQELSARSASPTW
ncbi:MAG TPA: hypothetical protein VFV01_18510 [Spirillospora sp.]|nr:hypothetical protein [Spirillospora sp.]